MSNLLTDFDWKDYGVKHGLDSDNKCVEHAIRASVVVNDSKETTVFDWKRYIKDHPDLQRTFGKKGPVHVNDATCHYLNHGRKESRKKYILGTNEPYVYDFDWKIYDKLNPDVYTQRHRTNVGEWHCFRHWCEYGYKEGRKTGGCKQLVVKTDASISTDDGVNKQWRYALSCIDKLHSCKSIDSIINLTRDSYYPLVVMPTYNRAANIEHSIQMMLNQSETKWTFLIIDDGSTVENKTLFRSIRDRHRENKQIIFLENDTNKHIAFTLNRGIQYFLQDSKFTHFTWFSDDNEYYPTFLEKLCIPGKDFTYSWYDIYYTTAENMGRRDINKQPLISFEFLLTGYNGCASFMWSRTAINRIGFYNENIPGCEDYEYMLRTIKYLPDDKRMQINCSLMQYVRHPESEFDKRFKEIKDIERKIVKIYKTLNVANQTPAFIYYSKTKYDVLFQRPHQIMRFYDKSVIKCFIGLVDDVLYEEKYNLLVIPYHLRECVYNVLSNHNITTYYTDSRLYNEVIQRPGKKLYDLIDAPIEEFTVWKPNLEKCVKNSDHVMYSHPDLVQFLNEIDANKKYHYISNACDYEHFSKAKSRIGERPVDFPSTDKPILGYYGAFAQWLDFDIIRKHADEGGYHIVMIGGIVNRPNYNLRFDHPNITWLNHKTYDELPYYLSWFDKCFLPFKDCELTTYVNPCKLWEYMACEKEIIKYNVNMADDIIVRYEDVCNKLNDIFNLYFLNYNKIIFNTYIPITQTILNYCKYWANYIIIAPYPYEHIVFEGYIKRINYLYYHIKRKYKNILFIFLNNNNNKNVINFIDEKSAELNLNYSFDSNLMLDLISNKQIHIETTHGCEYFFMHQILNKINFIIDIHGAAPEEELLIKNTGLEYWNKIEYAAIQYASIIITVNKSMIEHLTSKYNINIHDKTIVLGIISDDDDGGNSTQVKYNRDFNQRTGIVYSGGIQKWQCIDFILYNCVGKTEYQINFFTHNKKDLIKQLNSMKILDKINSIETFNNKHELKHAYNNNIFGFMLRENSVVNRVSCPTKLYDYISNNIVPVVYNNQVIMGDYFDLKSVNIDFILNNNILSEQEYTEIIEHNKNIMNNIKINNERNLIKLLELI